MSTGQNLTDVVPSRLGSGGPFHRGTISQIAVILLLLGDGRDLLTSETRLSVPRTESFAPDI